MSSEVLVRAQLDGGDASRHLMPAYDGFMSLAGIGLTLSLTANYAETGAVRHKGNFVGRHIVKATPIQDGSVITDFIVLLPRVASITGRAVSEAAGSAFFSDLFKRVLDRNLGIESEPVTDELAALIANRGGDIEALVAATEPSVKQAHSVIGEGAQVMNIFGGKPQISQFNNATKQYISGTVQDTQTLTKDVSVASFNVNSGYGGVFDFDLKRVVPIRVTSETAAGAKPVLGWGLNEYANGTGKRINLTYYRQLALDGSPKRYIVLDAKLLADSAQP
jgi:nitrogen regulatory protein PII